MKLSVIAHPNAKRPRVEEDLTGQIHVHVSSPPREGKANKAVIEALAKHFGVKKHAVRLVSGHTANIKRLEIHGI